MSGINRGSVRRRSRRGSPKPTHRSDGRWAIRFTYPRDASTGRPSRPPRLIYGRTGDEAQAKWDAEREAVDRDRWRAEGDTTFLTVATRWLQTKAPDARYRQGQPVRASTFHRDYELRLRTHAVPYLGHLPCERISAKTVDQWMIWLADNDRTDDTINRTLGRVKQVLAYAHAQQIIGGDPWWDRVTGPVLNGRRRQGVMTDADEEASARVLAAVEGHYLEVMYKVALVLGPRPGELRGLVAKNVDRKRRSINLQHTLDWAPGGVPVLEDAKTAAGERTIRLPDSLWEQFEALLDGRDMSPVAVLRHNEWIEVDLVFRRANGRPLRGDGAGGTNDLFRRCLRRAGMPEHNLYQLRHLAVGTLLRILEPREVAQIVGHSSYRMTLDVYAPRMREVLEKAAIDLEPIYAHLHGLDLARRAVNESGKDSPPRLNGRYVRDAAHG